MNSTSGHLIAAGKQLDLVQKVNMFYRFCFFPVFDYVYSDSCSLFNIEWNAMYTTHLTQKAKKYHDGFLQLANCGLRGRQVSTLNLLLHLHEVIIVLAS